jgi:hypothetical protein
MKKILSIACLLIITAGPLWSVGFMVSPPRYELIVGAGQNRTEMITIVNQENTQSLRLKVTVKAWEKDEMGRMSYYDPGDKPRSCGNWLAFNPSEFVLPPGGSEKPRFTISVPESAKGSYWAMIFFESQPDTAQKANVGVRMVGRVGVTVYANIYGTLNYQSQLTALNYRRAGYKNHEFTVGIRNDGNSYFRPKGTIVIKDPAGNKVATAEIPDEYVVLPDSDGRVKIVVKQVIAPGQYTATVSLDTGLPELLEGEVGFEVLP